MRYHQYPKLDSIKNYFLLSNELFALGLSAEESTVYAFLMRCEERDNYTCVVSYKEIGAAVNMSRNTARKYAAMLGDRLLIETEHTSVFTYGGLKGNKKLRYKILPIHRKFFHCWSESRFMLQDYPFYPGPRGSQRPEGEDFEIPVSCVATLGEGLYKCFLRDRRFGSCEGIDTGYLQIFLRCMLKKKLLDNRK